MPIGISYSTYHYQQISDPLLVAEFHVALAFGAPEKYKGGLLVELRHSDDQISVTSQSDEVSREFIIDFGGKTVLEETLASPNPYQRGKLKTTTHFLDQGGILQVDPIVGFSSEKRWLEGKELADELEWHSSMAKDIASLVEPLLEGAETSRTQQGQIEAVDDPPDRPVSLKDFIAALKHQRLG